MTLIKKTFYMFFNVLAFYRSRLVTNYLRLSVEKLKKIDHLMLKKISLAEIILN